MSFSSKLKDELCSLPKLKNCCRISELLGMILINGHITTREIKISTENEAVAKRICLHFKYGFGANAVIETSKNKLYTIMVNEKIPEINQELHLINNGRISYTIPRRLIEKNCCKKSFVRGLFLASGYLSDPEKRYHLELTTNHFKLSNEIVELMFDFGIISKISVRKSNYVIYIKERDTIADFLTVTGANASLMEFHNARILKDMRNNINRVSNFESANETKTINAAVNQANFIKYIDEKISISSLPDELQEIARLRVENPSISLKELAQMHSVPISKSGVNHRIKKLEKIAESLKKNSKE